MHVKDGDTPALRLEQDNSSFPAQTWDVGGNEVNFFVRDVTNSNALTFRIAAGAPANSIYVSETGNVGVGFTTPSEKLAVNGNLSFPSSNSPILVASEFNVESTEGVDIIIDNDDNSSNSSFRVKRNGESETIFEVQESGNIEVEGEYNYSSAKTHYQSFSWHSFDPLYPQFYEFGQSATVNNTYGEFVTGGLGIDYAVVQLNLPDGAELTELKAWIWDNASDAPVRVRLLALPLGSETTSTIANVESSSATANAAVQELTVDPNTTIDNSSNSYFLRFEGKQNRNDTRLYGVRVTYTVEKAD